MKFMIIQPMNGIDEAKIWEQREEIRKFIESKGHEVIDTFFIEEAPEGVKTPGIYYLGRAFMNGLAYADAVVLAPGWENARGCLMERSAAYRYNLEVYEFFKKGSKYYTQHIDTKILHDLNNNKSAQVFKTHICESDCLMKRDFYAVDKTIEVMPPNPKEIIK